MPAVTPGADGFVGKVADLTGPGLTDRFGMNCTDLGASVRAADGNLVSVFGDTFSGSRVGTGDWRSPVILIGTGDATHPIRYHRAGGADHGYARQLWHYRRRPNAACCAGASARLSPRTCCGSATRCFCTRSSTAGSATSPGRRSGGPRMTACPGRVWAVDRRSGRPARRPRPVLELGLRPSDGWVYVVSTGFQRDKGLILRRVRPEHIGDRSRYWSWAGANGARRPGIRDKRTRPPRSSPRLGRPGRTVAAAVGLRHLGSRRIPVILPTRWATEPCAASRQI